MQTGTEGKKYGLQLPSKIRNAFRDEDDALEKGDDQTSDNGPVDYYKQTTIKRNENTKVQKLQDEALLEDPTAFDYDSVYDSMKQERQRSAMARQQQNADNKPKYIQNLLVQAEKKKLEFERAKERAIQKEYEADAEKYKDKDVYITAGYKKKLEERKQREEMERLQEEKDSSKPGDINAFHRNLFNTSYGKVDETTKKDEIKKNDIKKEEEQPQQQPQQPSINDSIKENRGGLIVKKKRDDTNDQKYQQQQRSRNDGRNYYNDINYNNRSRYNNHQQQYHQQKQQQQKQQENQKKKEQENRYPRRNDEKSIEAARLRYLERKLEREKKSIK